MSGCEGYEAIAHVYDKLNAEIDYPAWADFVEACFDRFLPKRPELVLDLACGTGSMTLELAKRGYDMIGVDGSADMLSEAFSRAIGVPQILWLQQDMRAFELYGTVVAVICCLDSLNYLLSPEDLARCFACVHNYLDPDGLFLFDMNTPYKFRTVYGNNAYVLEDETVYGEGEADEERAAIYCGWQNTYHPDSGLCEFDLSLFEELPGGTYRRTDEHQTERCYELDTVLQLLKQAGLMPLGVWSDYAFAEANDTTERWYIAARAVKA
ncbi:MAG: class I SAM-dependent methyltransferase [Clostridia bacterium]|nr:class I SAM-dependent methyltransferase [Clostridia bacterium]